MFGGCRELMNFRINDAHLWKLLKYYYYSMWPNGKKSRNLMKSSAKNNIQINFQ